MEITAKSPVRSADAAAVGVAAQLLREGRLVAFPTETVYGLGADATNSRAVADIFAVKERPRFNPLIVHVENLGEASKYAGFNSLARELASAFWPGALTLVLPRVRNCALAELVSAGLNTVAVRVPAHPIAQEILARSGIPIAAPSANASGRISATTAEHVHRSLNGKVDLILDGGHTRLGLESSVIAFEGGKPVLLRTGALPRTELEKIAGPLATVGSASVRSPGQLASHYAPRASIRLMAQTVSADEVLLAFGSHEPHGARMTLNLSTSGNLQEAAANFFDMLHTLDATGLPIAVVPLPNEGLGEAINDRLTRAAAPRGPQ